MHCFQKGLSPFVRYFKGVISTTTLRKTMKIFTTVTLGEIDLVYLFKKIKIFM